jgi:hypothetical protein
MKAILGIIAICLGNTYKNYLTIELVFPRVGDAIRNFTELLDLNFNVLRSVGLEEIGYGKSAEVKYNYWHVEIDKTKTEKYVSEVERGLKLTSDSIEKISNELASVTSKNRTSFLHPTIFKCIIPLSFC